MTLRFMTATVLPHRQRTPIQRRRQIQSQEILGGPVYFNVPVVTEAFVQTENSSLIGRSPYLKYHY